MKKGPLVARLMKILLHFYLVFTTAITFNYVIKVGVLSTPVLFNYVMKVGVLAKPVLFNYVMKEGVLYTCVEAAEKDLCSITLAAHTI